MTSVRIWRALLLLGGLLLAAGLVVLSQQRPATGYHYGSIGSHDFLEYWSAYRALRAGADPYDGLVLHPIERDAGQSPGTTLFMWNPPWTVLLIAPVLECPFPAACLAWIVCNLALLAAIGLLVCDAAGITGGRELNGPAVLSSLLFYPAMETIELGQISLVLAFAVALFLRSAVRRNEVGAGLSLVLLTIKPHLFLIFGAWVLAWIVRERLWRMLAAAAFGLAALLLLTQLLWPGSPPRLVGEFRVSSSRPGRRGDRELDDSHPGELGPPARLPGVKPGTALAPGGGPSCRSDRDCCLPRAVTSRDHLARRDPSRALPVGGTGTLRLAVRSRGSGSRPGSARLARHAAGRGTRRSRRCVGCPRDLARHSGRAEPNVRRDAPAGLVSLGEPSALDLG
jgi:Glycosyltransferase family 87